MSEVKVNKITPRTDCGTTQLGDSGDTVTVTGDLRSDSLKAADGGVIISQSGTTITVGASGDTVSLASGASQSGFGRSGTVNWQTGSVKTANFTAANGEGYFADTSSGSFTMNLPAGTAGNIVSVVDYTNTFQTNSLTVAPNGSQKIGGIAQDAFLTSEGQSVTLVYVDDTEGWKNVQDSTSNITGTPFIVASGGTITNSPCGNDRIHTFTGPGTFAVSKVACSAPNNQVSYVVVAGGGGGGRDVGGGGGAGGFREDKSPVTPYTASPLEGAGSITVTAASFPITVGGGGAGGPSSSSPTPARDGVNGNSSIFSTITSAGGGGGGGYPGRDGLPGASGGGASGYNESHSGGSGNTPPTSPPQGNPGGNANSPSTGQSGGGGGGATATGSNSVSPNPSFTPRASGATTSITGSGTEYSQGGRGATDGASPHLAGGANTGTGGDAAGSPNAGSAGGSGIVIIRYKFK